MDARTTPGAAPRGRRPMAAAAPSSTTSRSASALLRRLATTLVEVQGQHDQVGLADPAHPCRAAGCLRWAGAAGAAPPRRAWRAWREPPRALAAAREAIAAAQRDEEFLRHAVRNCPTSRPRRARRRSSPRNASACSRASGAAESIAAALAELPPRDRRRGGPGDALRGAARALERLPAPNEEAQPILGCSAQAQDALAEARDAAAAAAARGRRRTRAGWRQAGGPAVRPARRRPQACGRRWWSCRRCWPQLKARLRRAGCRHRRVAALEAGRRHRPRAPISPPAGR